MAKPESQDIYRQRRHAGERPFAQIKHHFGARQFATRGQAKVNQEWKRICTAFNIKILMKALARIRAGPVAPKPNPLPAPG
jgi:hypothetical protein